LAEKEKELETLRAKVAELEAQNRNIVEELVKAKEESEAVSPEKTAEAAAALAELDAATEKLTKALEEVDELRARIVNLEETVWFHMIGIIMIYRGSDNFVDCTA
jgi:hypothetical protein